MSRLTLCRAAAIAMATAFASPSFAYTSTTTNLPDGLRIIETQIGTGPVAGPHSTVVVDYTGWLDEDGNRGKKFDSSADAHRPFTFTLGAHDVIPGWDEGVMGMKPGGKRTLIIPPDLAYAGKQQGPIPPWSTLIFDIELKEVK